MTAFHYPAAPHLRHHGPLGYADAESYRPWLRDEFIADSVSVGDDGQIVGLTTESRRLIRLLGLDGREETEARMLWIGIIALAERYDTPLFQVPLTNSWVLFAPMSGATFAFSKAWPGKYMICEVYEKAKNLGGPGPSESFTRPDPTIPCQIARQQSLTPFRHSTT